MAKTAKSKDSDSTSASRSIQPVRKGPETDLNLLRRTVQRAACDGSAPSAEGIAAELAGMPTHQRASALLGMQQTLGNRRVGKLAVQAKLVLGPVGDRYEQEADRVARQVVETISTSGQKTVQRQEVEEEELIEGKFASELTGTLQTKEEAPPNRTGMPDLLKSGLESLSGMDLSGVRVHYNSSKPAQLNALAYTQGQDIHVGPGQERHLAHEGWHAVQQMKGRVKPTMQAKDVSINDDEALEHEADMMAAKAATTEISAPFSSPSVAKDQEPVLQARVLPYKNAKDEYEGTVGNFTSNLDNNVQKAWAIVLHRPLTNMESAIDGYTRRWQEEWANYQKDKKNTGMVPAMFGYAVESLSTKLLPNPAPGLGLYPKLQATRGRTRPDIILERDSTDVAWLDITAEDSQGHIKAKEGGGWNQKPYVAEVLYPSVTAQSITAQQESYQSNPFNLGNTEALADNFLRSRAKFEAQKEIWKDKARELIAPVLQINNYNDRKVRTTKILKDLLQFEQLLPIEVGSILYMCGLNPINYGFRRRDSTGSGYTSQWSSPVPVSIAESLFQDYGNTLPLPSNERVEKWYEHLKSGGGISS